jgi:hypothetical protein
MKALLPLAASAALSLALFSCQQAYQDKAAETANTGAPGTTLSAPSMSPSDSSYILPTGTVPPLSYINNSDAYNAAIANTMGQEAYTFVTNLIFASGKGNIVAPHLPRAAATTGGSGPSSGYTLLFGSYSATSGSGDVTDPGSNIVGSDTSSALQYFEESNDYFNNFSSVFKLYKRAFHYLDTSSISAHLTADSTVVPSYTISGVYKLNTRGETNIDVNVTGIDGAGYSVGTGRAEAAAGFSLAMTYSTVDASENPILVGGKFIVSVSASQPYQLYNNELYNGTSNVVTLDYTVNGYDNHGNLIYSNTNFGAYYYSAPVSEP